MRSKDRLVSLAVLALGAAIALGGCKKSEAPAANNQPAQQPAAAPAAGTAPADQTGQSAQSAPSQPAPAAPPTTSSQPASTDQAAAPVATAPAAAPAPPQPTVVILPRGTLISVRLDQDLGSKISQTGQGFRATVASAVKVNGQTLIPVGSRANGVVTDAEPLGKIKGEARLAVTLQRIHTPWGAYPVATSSIARVEKGKGKRTAIMGGGGAGLGAIIGGLAGGGKGALIGGLAGGGAGTAGSAFTGNKQIELPTETLLTFRLQQSVHITTDNGQ